MELIKNRFLYRVWDKTQNKMIYEDLGAYCSCDKGLQNCYDDAVLMQCTGMLDVNGLKIFEGDIVRFTHSSDPQHNLDAALVEWKTEWCGFYIDGNRTLNWRMRLVIIGNIYENPDLVGGQV